MASTAEQAEWVRKVLGFTLPDDPGASSSPLDVWLDAKERLDDQVSALQKVIRALDHPLAQKIADRGLVGLAGKWQVGLQAALMDYRAASADDRSKRANAVIAATGRLRSFLGSDPALPVLERNPLGVAVDIRSTLGKAADRIDGLMAS